MGIYSRIRKPSLILAILGLLSGLATCPTMLYLFSRSPRWFPSCAIIFAFALYSWCCEGIHSAWRVIGFIIFSTLAFWIAVFAGGLGATGVRDLTGIQDLGMNAVLLGGVVGTAQVALARYVFLSGRRGRSALLRSIGLIALVGGVLGETGDSLGPSLGAAIWHLLRLLRLLSPAESSPAQAGSSTLSLFSMFVLWQTAIAPLLVLLFPHSPIPVQIRAEASRTG